MLIDMHGSIRKGYIHLKGLYNRKNFSYMINIGNAYIGSIGKINMFYIFHDKHYDNIKLEVFLLLEQDTKLLCDSAFSQSFHGILALLPSSLNILQFGHAQFY